MARKTTLITCVSSWSSRRWSSSWRPAGATKRPRRPPVRRPPRRHRDYRGGRQRRSQDPQDRHDHASDRSSLRSRRSRSPAAGSSTPTTSTTPGGVKIGNDTYKIQFIHEDSKGSAEGASTAATKLVNQDKVELVIGAILESEMAAIYQVTEAGRRALRAGERQHPGRAAGRVGRQDRSRSVRSSTTTTPSRSTSTTSKRPIRTPRRSPSRFPISATRA